MKKAIKTNKVIKDQQTTNSPKQSEIRPEIYRMRECLYCQSLVGLDSSDKDRK